MLNKPPPRKIETNVVASRVAWDRDYAAYFAARQAQTTEFIDQRAKD